MNEFCHRTLKFWIGLANLQGKTVRPGHRWRSEVLEVIRLDAIQPVAAIGYLICASQASACCKALQPAEPRDLDSGPPRAGTLALTTGYADPAFQGLYASGKLACAK